MKKILFGMVILVSLPQARGFAQVAVVPTALADLTDDASGLRYKRSQQALPVCEQFLPKRSSSGCRVDYVLEGAGTPGFVPRVHNEVAVSQGGSATVLLLGSSPFASCTVTSAPSALARDPSTAIGSLLTVVGTLGAVPTVAALPAGMAAAELDGKLGADALLGKGAPEMEKDKLPITAALETIRRELAVPTDQIQRHFEDLDAIRKALKYSYSDQDAARNGLEEVYAKASDFLARPLPDDKSIAALQKEIRADLRSATRLVSSFEAKYGTDSQGAAFARDVKERLAGQTRLADGMSDLLKDPRVGADLAIVADLTALVKTVFDLTLAHRDAGKRGVVSFADDDFSVVALPLQAYRNSKVAVQVKCVDAVTKAPLFDTLQFNAYYQGPTRFDISAGFVVSTLHGREVGVVTEPYIPITSATPQTYYAAVTSRSRVQFIPATFVEWHPWDFQWRKSTEFGRVHRFGNFGSFGPAVGLLINPNNGSTQAEYFEGVSVGVDRFAFMIGNHTGHSQNFTGGFVVGQSLAAGIVPPTVEDWSQGLAFGVTYRIPLR